ncbi:MAG: CDGSH iron-sulfur domain-containing protein [Sinimarinibacterium sp.]|jgi:CDGSH-type Zn-finger protein
MSDDPHTPHCAQAAPFLLQLAPGEYQWCACGRSQRQPFCDGSHVGTDLRPLRFTVSGKPRLVWLCGCKQSHSRPHCDGTHNRLPT